MSADHVGPLRWMLDPPDDGARGDAGPGGDVSRGLDTAGVVSEWPEVQPLLSDEMRDPVGTSGGVLTCGRTKELRWLGI